MSLGPLPLVTQTAMTRTADLTNRKECDTVDPFVQRRCDNPRCLEVMTWFAGRGRPQRYCSDPCRQRMLASRQRLDEEAAHLTRQIDAGVTYRKERELRSELARVDWLLSAYPQPSANGRNR